MKIKQLLAIAALGVTALFTNTATAQVEYATDLEGIYNMTFDGAPDPAYGGTWNAGGTAVVELHAIDDENIQMSGFLHPDVTVHAAIDLDLMTVTLPYQVVSDELLELVESYNKFNAIGAGEYNWNYDGYVGLTTPVRGTFSNDKTIKLNGILAALRDGQEFAVKVYQNVKLTYDGPLPATGVAQVGSTAVAAERWYTIDGREVVRPAGRDGQIYIVVRQMQDGKVNSVKLRN